MSETERDSGEIHTHTCTHMNRVMDIKEARNKKRKNESLRIMLRWVGGVGGMGCDCIFC